MSQFAFRTLIAAAIAGANVCCAQSMISASADAKVQTAGIHEASPLASTTGASGPAAAGDERLPSTQAAPDPWGPVPTNRASAANLAPLLLPYFNNGPVFGLPGTEQGDFFHRTQLSGDWGGLRTNLARRGYFFDLYTTGAYQDVVSGGIRTGGSFIQNNQLSINVTRDVLVCGPAASSI